MKLFSQWLIEAVPPTMDMQSPLPSTMTKPPLIPPAGMKDPLNTGGMLPPSPPTSSPAMPSLSPESPLSTPATKPKIIKINTVWDALEKELDNKSLDLAVNHKKPEKQKTQTQSLWT